MWQASCSLKLACQLVQTEHHMAAIRDLTQTLALHSDYMAKEEVITARAHRDECLLKLVRSCADPEECADALRCVQRGVEVARPAAIDSSVWAAWKTKDKKLLLLLLEARVEQLRDYKSGSPTYRVGKDKFEAVLRWCESVVQGQGGSSAESSPAQPGRQDAGKQAGAGAGAAEGGGDDMTTLAIEVHLWLAAGAFARACSISPDANIDMAIASSHEALEHVSNAEKALGIEGSQGSGHGDAQGEAPGADFLSGRLGEGNRTGVCAALSAAIRVKLKWQEEQQLERAAAAEQVQRALEEQRKLEEEAKELKKREADERQRKAREERQRKEVEKKHQQMLEREEAVRKKAEEVAAKKREAEERRRKSEMAAVREEEERVRREEEERVKAEAAEKVRLFCKLFLSRRLIFVP